MDNLPLHQQKKYIQDLCIFYDTFNQRPVSGNQKLELYYSEKLITKQQLENYEKAIREITFDYIRRAKAKGIKAEFSALVSATRYIEKNS